MTRQIHTSIAAVLLLCATLAVLTACTKDDDAGNTAATTLPLATGDISQAVAE